MGKQATRKKTCPREGIELAGDLQQKQRYNPLISEPKGGGGSSGSSSAALQPKGGLFQGGVPKLRPVGAKDSSGIQEITL